MNLDSLISAFARIILVLATTTMLLAFAEGFANLFGTSLIARFYAAGRLLEFAAILLVFVIVQLLRQIRDALREGSASRPG